MLLDELVLPESIGLDTDEASVLDMGMAPPNVLDSKDAMLRPPDVCVSSGENCDCVLDEEAAAMNVPAVEDSEFPEDGKPGPIVDGNIVCIENS